jgi:fermentation-respiration switch protein FrsA (DUF1100 family)
MVDLFPRDAAAWRRTAKRTAGAALVLVGGAMLFVGCAERSLLYPARYLPTPDPAALPTHAREIAIPHEEGRTFGHLYLGRGVDAEHPGPLVLFSHGNGELIENYAPGGLRGYHDMGVSVLLVEYRGLGRSDGSPNKIDIDADHVAFYDLVVTLPEVDADRIVLHGRSMGGGIVASLAQQRPGAALILESTYTSIEDFAARLFLPRFLVKDKWDVAATLRTYDRPVFMTHSPRDEVIPHAMSVRNRDVRPAELPPITFTEYDVGHNDPMPPAFFDDVEAFFRDHGILPETADLPE